MPQTAKNIIFTGRVQGVGFRFTAFHMANRYQLTGQIRNLNDGSVEMVVQGNSDDINDCIRDIEESFTGCISKTRIEEIPCDPRYKDFKITF